VAVLAAILGAPGGALACPACAGNPDGGVAKIVALGVMILLPFAISGFVVRAIRNALPPG
jgi:hypothetical protein